VTPRRLLIVSYFHPPFPAAGGSRWVAMTRHLRALGHSVTILAGDAWGCLPDDEKLDVVRVGDLRSVKPLRRVLRRGRLAVAGDLDVTEPPSTALLTKIFVPDAQIVSWLPRLVTAIRRLLEPGDVDCIVTTSPPESAHVAGLLLGARRPAWIADFRDGWRFEPLRPAFPTAPQRALDAWLERRVIETAEISVAATRPIASDFERRLGAGVTWVPNGWDPASPVSDTHPHHARKSGELTLVHTGALSGAWGRDPEPLLRALLAVRAEGGRTTLRLVHAGRLTTDERALIARIGVVELMEHLGTLDRPSTLALQRSADALLLLTSRNTSEATSKIFEYLAAGRPIVALAQGNEAERIVRETCSGIAVPPDDCGAIAAALRQVLSGELARAYAPKGVERFMYPHLAETMAELVETAIQRRREVT
jgi:glycosyltransferase involved in cell wall biosynthesis